MSNEKILHQDPKEIAKYVISHTPIGLLNKSLESLKILVKDEVLKSPEILKELQMYKENHLIPISVPNIKTKVLISPYNKDSDDFYYDQIQKIRFKLNDKYEPENIEEYAINTEIFRKIWRRMDEYIKKYYNKDAVYYNVYNNAILNRVQILISGKIINTKNSWTGEWLSIWCMDIEQKIIDGEIKINTIYYEEGNVQFNFNKKYEKTIKVTDESAMCDEFLEFIEKNENDVQNKIEELNKNLSEVYVKPLRKRISIIEKEMNWSLDQIQFK
jgi:hypothetical protein